MWLELYRYQNSRYNDKTFRAAFIQTAPSYLFPWVILVLTTFRPPYLFFLSSDFMTQVLLTQLSLSTLCATVHLFSFHLIALRKVEKNEKKVISITTLHFRHHFYTLECLLHVSPHSQAIITHNHGIELYKKQDFYTTQFRKFNFLICSSTSMPASDCGL